MEVITQTTEAIYNSQGLWTWVAIFSAIAFCIAYLVTSLTFGEFHITSAAFALVPALIMGGIVFSFAGLTYKTNYNNDTHEKIQQELIECGYVGPSTGQGKWTAYLDKVEVEGTYNFVGSDIYILGEHGCNE